MVWVIQATNGGKHLVGLRHNDKGDRMRTNDEPQAETQVEHSGLPLCSLRTCCRKHWQQDAGREAYVLSGGIGPILMNPIGMPFMCCGVCGNKRCPKATDCDLMCTGSNEPGQDGSVY